MQKQSYIIKYENNKEDFKEFFGKDADIYWKIWELHNIEKFRMIYWLIIIIMQKQL